MHRASLRLTAAAAALLALSACASATRMSVGGPGSLIRLPVANPSDARDPRFAPRDSLAAAHRGHVVAAGDSLVVFTLMEPGRPLTGAPATIYRVQRVTPMLEIWSYQTLDRRWHDWPGAVRAVDDSLEFLIPYRRPGRLQHGVPADTLRLPREAVAALMIDRKDPIPTILSITIGAALAVALLVAGTILAKASLVN